MPAKEQMDTVYGTDVEATEEAIMNALVAAETMEGIDHNKSYDRLQQIMKKYNRLESKK